MNPVVFFIAIAVGFVAYFTNIDEQEEREARERAQLEQTERPDAE